MPIYDQSFRRYEGERKTTWLWWPVARQTFRPVLKSKLAWLLLLALVVYVVVLSVGFFASAKIAEMAPGQVQEATKAARAQKLPLFGKDANMSTVLHMFLGPTFGVLWLLILITGGGSVSTDLRHSALPLYFSRPLRPWEYALGKVFGLSLLPIFALWTALLLLFVQYAGYFRDFSGAIQELPGLFYAMLYVVLMSVFISLTMTAFSSTAKTPRTASVMYLGFFLLTGALARALSRGARKNDLGEFARQLRVISPRHCLELISEKLLKPDLNLIGPSQDLSGLLLPAAIGSLGIYSFLLLWLLWRNLKVVEVVK